MQQRKAVSLLVVSQTLYSGAACVAISRSLTSLTSREQNIALGSVLQSVVCMGMLLRRCFSKHFFLACKEAPLLELRPHDPHLKRCCGLSTRPKNGRLGCLSFPAFYRSWFRMKRVFTHTFLQKVVLLSRSLFLISAVPRWKGSESIFGVPLIICSGSSGCRFHDLCVVESRLSLPLKYWELRADRYH